MYMNVATTREHTAGGKYLVEGRGMAPGHTMCGLFGRVDSARLNVEGAVRAISFWHWNESMVLLGVSIEAIGTAGGLMTRIKTIVQVTIKCSCSRSSHLKLKKVRCRR